MDKIGLKKELKHLHLPSAKKVEIVDLPEFKFVMLDGCDQDSAILEIIEITDFYNGLLVPHINVFVRLDDLPPGEDGGRFINTKPPINIPIEVGVLLIPF